MYKKLVSLITSALLSSTVLTGSAAAANAVPVEAPPATDVRVMSFNIHYGADRAGTLDLERTASDIEASGAEIIGLQEVDNHWSSRSDFVDEAQRLADRLDMHVAYGPALDRDPLDGETQRRQYGNAILSEYPILHSENQLLTNIEYAERPTEQRALLSAVINIEGNHVTFHTTHLDVQRSEQRQLQAKEILAVAEASNRPSILVGDLNAVPGTPEVETLLTSFSDSFAELGQGDDFTIPVVDPDRRIDYILTSDGIEVRSAEVIATTSSDHLPIIADLAIPQTPNGLNK